MLKSEMLDLIIDAAMRCENAELHDTAAELRLVAKELHSRVVLESGQGRIIKAELYAEHDQPCN